MTVLQAGRPESHPVQAGVKLERPGEKDELKAEDAGKQKDSPSRRWGCAHLKLG